MWSMVSLMIYEDTDNYIQTGFKTMSLQFPGIHSVISNLPVGQKAKRHTEMMAPERSGHPWPSPPPEEKITSDQSEQTSVSKSSHVRHAGWWF